MKKNYTTPKIEITELKNEDIITLSTSNGGGSMLNGGRAADVNGRGNIDFSNLSK